MLSIDKNGMVVAKRIQSKRYPGIEHGRLAQVRSVVHQTDSPYRHPEVSYKNPGESAGATW